MRKFFTILFCKLFFYNLLFCQYIEEFDYDQPGTDATEFIDVFFPTGSNLIDFQIVLFNGTSEYNTIEANTQDCVSVPGGQLCTWDPAGTDNIQNGGSDGIMLYNNLTNTMVHGFSY